MDADPVTPPVPRLTVRVTVNPPDLAECAAAAREDRETYLDRYDHEPAETEE